MKQVLAVSGLDGETRVACKCGKEMEWQPDGTDRHIGAGNLSGVDHNGYWYCKSCGYTEDE